MSSITLNQVYEYDFTGTIQFGSLSPDFLYEMFRDGRFCCEPLSRHLEQQFDGLEFVDRKGYDFIHPELGKIEKKQITKGGLKFCPSAMIGAGRKVNYTEVIEHIINNDLIYVLADITCFPQVKVTFIKGTDLLDNCTSKNASFSRKQVQSIFFNATQS